MRRYATVRTPLRADALHLLSLRAHEGLSELFEFSAELLTEDLNLDLSRLVGQTMVIELELEDGRTRQFSGIVSDLAQLGMQGRYFRYGARLRPWLWLLSQNRNCRTYKDTTVPDLAEKLFREHGITDFTRRLTGAYRKWEFLVQYRESDAAFICRLLEREGIYFYFVHEKGRHTLVLSDSICSHQAQPGYERIPYFPPTAAGRRERDHLDDWRTLRRLRPGRAMLADFSFERPRTPVGASAGSGAAAAMGALEVFDYPGEFTTTEEAEAAARLQLERQQVDVEQVEAAGNVRGLYAGCLFTLEQFPREDQNKEYLVTRMTYEVEVPAYESGSQSTELTFRCHVSAMDSKRPYRPLELTPKPKVEGPQTATVVGPPDKEIWTDSYGRVRVRFHWDHQSTSFEECSCWVRVSQVWAGSGFGGIHIPRIGQEVVVDFLEGNPDRPLVVGRVYNASNMPPYALPANQTQSGLKTRSSRDGVATDCNELRFEDAKDAEEVYLQAQKNMTTLVKNDQSTSILQNRVTSIGVSDTLNVAGDISVNIGHPDRPPRASKMNVTGKHTLETSDSIHIQAPNLIQLSVGGSSITITPGGITISAGGGGSIQLDADILARAQGGANMHLNTTAVTKANDGAQLTLDANAFMKGNAGAKLLLDGNVLAESSQSSKLVLDGNSALISSADVILDGDQVTGVGKSTASLGVGGSCVKVNPSGAEMKGTTANVNGTGTVSIAAPLVKIN